MSLEIWDFLEEEVKSETPERIISEVNFHLNKLITNNLLTKEPGIVCRIGRKGLHLLNRYETRISERGFTLSHLRVLSEERFMGMGKLSPGPLYIFVDSINTGKEMNKVLPFLKRRKIEVKNIFCYIYNEEAINKLEESGLIDKECVIGVFSSSSEKEYKIQTQKILTFFKSRIEPMDLDVCVDLYALSDVLVRTAQLELGEAIKQTLGLGVSVTEPSQRGLPSNISELFILKMDTSDLNLDRELPEFRDLQVTIDSLCVKIKTNIRQADSELSIRVIPKYLISTEATKEHIEDIEFCLLNGYTGAPPTATRAS